MDPGAWGVASPPRVNVDFVVNSAFVVKTLQVRQQGGLRELHRFWRWPQRSSHGRDQLGYRPCTLTRGPAPKSTTTLFYIAVFFLLFFLRKRGNEVLEKVARGRWRPTVGTGKSRSTKGATRSTRWWKRASRSRLQTSASELISAAQGRCVRSRGR